jgi:predicted MFS family arabinose efflux permease
MVGAFGGGAFAGTLLYGVAHRLPSRRLTFLSSFVVAPAVGFGTLAATSPLGVVVAAAALAGLIAGPIDPLYETVVQERTPPQIWVGLGRRLRRRGGARPNDRRHGCYLFGGDPRHAL